jgi:hypothetical protein
MRILVLICLIGLGCQNQSNTGNAPGGDSKVTPEKGRSREDDRQLEPKAEQKKETPKDDPELEKTRIAQATADCAMWEKAVQAYRNAKNDKLPSALKDVVSFMKDGKDKLLSPWGTPYVLEVDSTEVLAEPRVTTTTDKHQLVTKRGIESKQKAPKP